VVEAAESQPAAQLPVGTPAAEVAIDDALVTALLADQHPDLVHLPLRLVASGWDNLIFRLGEALAVRLPRRAVAAELILNEQRWLPQLAPRLPLPIPAPLRIGEPGRGYPWRWSVLPWLAGDTADEAPPDPGEATTFAAFLRALHAPAPANAPHNSVRGGPLHGRAAAFEARWQRLSAREDLLPPELRALWASALAAPLAAERSWLHGDLHPRNILTAHGRLSAVIDWGDITAGDPATDLAAIWMLLETPAARASALAAYAPDAQTLARARGWALHLGLTLLDTGLVDHPQHAAIGLRTLQRLRADG
jgi:aminoglycoside phosphotransferase (APT) family kinase protein